MATKSEGVFVTAVRGRREDGATMADDLVKRIDEGGGRSLERVSLDSRDRDNGQAY
jgi:hypothetical protein